MPRIAVEIETLVEDLFADLCAAVRRRVRAAAFVGAAGIEPELDEIASSLSFENHRINARLECARVARGQGFVDGLASDAIRIELSDIEMGAQKITRTAAIGRSSGNGEANQTGAFVMKVPVASGEPMSAAAGMMESGADHFMFLAVA